MSFADIILTARKYGVFDWLAVITFLAIGLALEMQKFDSNFVPYITSDIDNPIHTSTIPYPYLCIFTFGVGAFIVLFIWILHRRDHTVSKILAAYFFALSFTIFVSSSLKRLVGRPRPDTMTVCGGDGSYRQCASVLEAHALADQFHSFPSGHAAEAMSVAIFISLLLCEVWESGAMYAAALKMAPIVWALFISASRIWDRAHHVDDVLVGLLIGAFIGFFSFRTFHIGMSLDARKGGAVGTDTSASQFSAYV